MEIFEYFLDLLFSLPDMPLFYPMIGSFVVFCIIMLIFSLVWGNKK